MNKILSLALSLGIAQSKSTFDPLLKDKNLKNLGLDDDFIGGEFTTLLDNWNETSKEFGLRYWEKNSTWEK